MRIQFKKSLSEYKYLVMFDLASHVTGVCLWNIPKHKPVATQVIKVTNTCESKTKQLYEELTNYFNQLTQQGINLQDVLVYKEAMPTQVHGGSSTIQTFLALAKSHAILDFFLENNNIDYYDEVGVYPASTHAYFRHLQGLTNKDKVEKTAVRGYVQTTFGLSDLILDESDAVFLAQTFVDVKWNKDIDEEIRNVKRHKKTLKVAHVIQEYESQIKFLTSLKQ